MSKYYRSNGLYDYLDRNPNLSLKFPKGDLWTLIYADKEENFEPRVLALVVGVDAAGNGPANVLETKDLLEQISNRTGVPLVTIIFRTDVSNITSVSYALGNEPTSTISLNQLAQNLNNLGLPLNNQITNHAINSASSSAYQNWQRDNLGNRIVAVDIDMFKISVQGDIIKFYELKRSFMSFDRWRPYVDDYNNFRAISRLANLCDVQFEIVYNIRTKNPWNDDVSNLNIFEVDFRNNPPISEGRSISLNDFLR